MKKTHIGHCDTCHGHECRLTDETKKIIDGRKERYSVSEFIGIIEKLRGHYDYSVADAFRIEELLTDLKEGNYI